MRFDKLYCRLALLFQVWAVCWLRTRRRLRNVQDMFESKIKKSNLRPEKVHQSSRSLRPHQNRRQEWRRIRTKRGWIRTKSWKVCRTFQLRNSSGQHGIGSSRRRNDGAVKLSALWLSYCNTNIKYKLNTFFYLVASGGFYFITFSIWGC